MRINLNALTQKFRYLLFLLRKKGIKYTYNNLYLFFVFKSPLLNKFLNWLQPYPSRFQIEITNRCNLKCIMCSHTYWKRPEKELSFEEFKSIVDQFPNLKLVALYGIGENLLNKDFLKMFRYLKSKGIFVAFTDNFFFMDKKMAAELIDMGLETIFASIDAATKETYEKTRIGSNFERVIKNVRFFFQLKKKRDVYFPEFFFNYVINKYNLGEIIQYIELAAKVSEGEKTNINFTGMIKVCKEVEDFYLRGGEEIPEEVIQKSIEKGKELGIPVNWNFNTRKIKPKISECAFRLIPFIFATGDVAPCCHARMNGHPFLGNIFEQSFKEIWQGDKYKSFRKMLRQGKVPLYCKDCDFIDESLNGVNPKLP